jgi:periplasmic copper chaperone A
VSPGTPARVPARTLVAGTALVLAGACSAAGGGSGGVEVSDAWAAQADQVAAVYLTIDNGGEDDRLVAASSDAADDVSLMGHGGADASAHTAAEAPVDLPVPSGTTELGPGGTHVMLDGLDGPLRPGDRVPLTLRFERAGPRTVDVEILAWDDVVDRMSDSDPSAAGGAGRALDPASDPRGQRAELAAAGHARWGPEGAR